MAPPWSDSTRRSIRLSSSGLTSTSTRPGRLEAAPSTPTTGLLKVTVSGPNGAILGATVSLVSAPDGQTGPKIKQALVPPKPNELLSA